MSGKTQQEFPSINHAIVGYCYRVWILSVLITPPLSVLYAIITGSDHTTLNYGIKITISIWLIPAYFLAIAFYIALAAPAMILYWITFWKIYNTESSLSYKKLSLVAIALSGLWLTAFFFSGKFFLPLVSLNGSYIDMIIFSVVITILSFTLNLKSKQ